ncbi:MAG: hypothetical protein LKJ86_03710 [Oscillibacter sp.]|nr:hypothetical protein [Oscillibacter sp.]
MMDFKMLNEKIRSEAYEHTVHPASVLPDDAVLDAKESAEWNRVEVERHNQMAHKDWDR